MGKFERKQQSYSVSAGHVRIVPNEDGYTVLFLPNGYYADTYAMIGVVVEPTASGDGWKPWHGQTPLSPCERLRDAVSAVVDAATGVAAQASELRRSARG